jgi:hypothetical protein
MHELSEFLTPEEIAEARRAAKRAAAQKPNRAERQALNGDGIRQELDETDAIIARLAKLSRVDYERERKDAAPEKRCGKTTLLDVVGLLVPRPLSTANITVAATFRTIEAARPTLLIDEADTFLGTNEELRGILNSGHRAGGRVIRTVGEDFEAKVFSTHCPAAIAQIGKLPDTLADRSIHISMKRRAPGETVSRFLLGRTPELSEAAMKAARWIADNAEAIRDCDPDIPESIFNRAADNWAPLFAIAEVAGGDIAERARQAALAACGIQEDMSRGPCFLLTFMRHLLRVVALKCLAPVWLPRSSPWRIGPGVSAVMESLLLKTGSRVSLSHLGFVPKT